ncbi:DciA family protein [Streptacidiphilus sp. MAP5-52]|uniref:DciA family protein n=1 Tax=Streptacidiphilus sp. MAP5-52 TaxID=3156267 RepID=UPI0035121A5C
MTENPTEQLLPEQAGAIEDGDGQEHQEPEELEPQLELSGVDLAKVALQSAREAARRRGTEPAAKRRSTTRQGRGQVRGDGREPVGLGGALRGLMASRAWETPVAGGSVLADWPTIAPDLAAHTVAVAHDPETGRLDLRPSSPAWALQLRLHATELVARIGRHAGSGVVRSINVLPPGHVQALQAAVAEPVVSTAAAVPVKPREPSAGYRLALETLRATKPASTAPPSVRAAIERQNAAMAREPEEAFAPALEERLRLEAEQRQAADVHRRALLRARQERAAAQVPSIAPKQSAGPGQLGQTA